MSLFNLYLYATEESTSESSAFDSLKSIGQKIVPNDIWAFVIQLCATFILVIILAYFLVKPAKKFINARKQYIANNLEEAKTKNEEADSKLQEAANQLKVARKTSKEIVDTAKVTALNEKDRIVEETEKEVLEMKKKATNDIENERNKMKKELTDEMVDVAILAASKVVDREITEKDNRKIVSDFIKENNDE